MEQARRKGDDDIDTTSERMRSVEQMADGLEKVLRFSLPTKAPEGGRPINLARDFTAAIDIVHEAAESLKAAETRAREADSRTQALAQRATEELKNAEMRIQAAEARARSAETRLAEAEGRLKEAEDWLRQIFTTISDEFPVRR